MTRMKKVVITAFGDESKLAIVESDLPDPGADEVQLSVEYSIVCGSDVSMRRGAYPFQKKPPLSPGYSVIGRARLNGNGCSRFKIGDRLACLTKYDGQAELINLPEKYLIPVPEGVDPKAADALILDWVMRLTSRPATRSSFTRSAEPWVVRCYALASSRALRSSAPPPQRNTKNCGDLELCLSITQTRIGFRRSRNWAASTQSLIPSATRASTNRIQSSARVVCWWAMA